MSPVTWAPNAETSVSPNQCARSTLIVHKIRSLLHFESFGTWVVLRGPSVGGRIWTRVQL